jgi:hypothetical protein
MEIYKIKEFTRAWQYIFYYIELALCPLLAFAAGFNHLILNIDFSKHWVWTFLDFIVAGMFSWMMFIGSKIWFGHRVVAIKTDKLSSRYQDWEVAQIYVKSKSSQTTSKENEELK